ncbi:MAG: exo-beta-N-acetylmuramidase NamZ family protein [Methyloceanibacter sp.]|uniref:exo-beta-N-acetylmuramidase NamZ family protein n=1 Tax=Methyloceanibacter sp. TaxID=1965321 RepID=UPI003D6CE596
MLLGSERLIASSRLNGLRVGILANPASSDRDYRHIVDLLAASSNFKLAAIFGPQHGFRSDLQDNMIETPHMVDPRRHVPVFSLYSETREPTQEMLNLIDVLVIDLQDVGARIYTFIYTMANCLRAAARAGVPVIVCDRPNPIGGVQVEGPMLEPGFESFVGQFPIPMRHGMTVAELARLFNEHHAIGAPLEVVPMEGWSRELYFDDTEIPWIMPSPNMPTLDTAIVYPGTVLFEGTMMSEGRGTTRPFELIGAPWLDGAALAARLNQAGLAGVYFREIVFEPTFQKHARVPCGGCQIHVNSRWDFEPVKAGVAVMREVFTLSGDKFQWREPPYEYEHDKMPIDILAGSALVREQIEQQAPLDDIAASWRSGVKDFEQLRKPYLLY